jgi:hypothetical protein
MGFLANTKLASPQAVARIISLSVGVQRMGQEEFNVPPREIKP